MTREDKRFAVLLAACVAAMVLAAWVVFGVATKVTIEGIVIFAFVCYGCLGLLFLGARL